MSEGQNKMKKLMLFFLCIVSLAIGLCLGIMAEDTVMQEYEESDTAYTIYTDEQYKEVLVGVYEGTLPNKTIVLGCDLSVTYDLYMEKPCDITIDLNGKTYTNNYRPTKAGDFDLRHKDAIIRIKNGNMVCNFCVFVFQSNRNTEYSSVDNMGQVYLENVNIDSAEEVIYWYGGYGGVLSFKNCNLNVRGDYKTNGGGTCGTGNGMLYQMEGCTFDGFNAHCALPGSYFKDCVIYDRELFIDSWHGHGENGSDVEIELTNVQVEVQLRLNDARIDPVLYDCTYPKVVLTGNQQLIVAYTSATCDKAGTKTDYKGSGAGVLDESYNAPALGHTIGTVEDVRYINYFEKGFKYGYCERCENNATETEASAPAVFTSLGFSYSQYEGAPSSVIQGFKFNEEARIYMGEDFEFGIVAAVNESGEAIDALSLPKSIKASLKEGYFEIKIGGIRGEHKDICIVFCAYMTNNGETFYLDNGETKVDVTGHTYNQVLTYN